MKPINKMASSVFDPEIERFITPIRGLYKEYITTVDELMTKSPEILKNKVVDTGSVRDGYLIFNSSVTVKKVRLLKNKFKHGSVTITLR